MKCGTISDVSSLTRTDALDWTQVLRQFVLVMKTMPPSVPYPYCILPSSEEDEAAEKKGVNLTEILANAKPSSSTTESSEGKKKPGKRWRTPPKFHLLGDRRKAGSAADSGSADAKNNNRQLDKQCSLEELDPNDMTLLQLLALNALDLTAPASDILLKNRKNNWVQLSGHEGAFAPAGPGTIWKKRTVNDNSEVKAYENLMRDTAADLVPCFYKEVQWNNDYYIEMQDLLHSFKDPSVMDIKMGTRTFAESEVTNQKARPDLYEKLIKLDPKYPTEEENRARAMTKMRYMTFREQQSSSSTLGFRIEALKLEGSAPIKDLKLVRTSDEVLCTMNLFLAGRNDCRRQLLERFREMRDKLQRSEFFRKHEVVGSSILIVMDEDKANAWMIDFAKTFRVPSRTSLTHRRPWVRGNHEDGYLLGLDNLIQILEKVDTQSVTPLEPSNTSSESQPSSAGHHPRCNGSSSSQYSASNTVSGASSSHECSSSSRPSEKS